MWGALNWKKEAVRFEQVLSRLLIVVSTFLSLDQYICQKGNAFNLGDLNLENLLLFKWVGTGWGAVVLDKYTNSR